MERLVRIMLYIGWVSIAAAFLFRAQIVLSHSESLVLRLGLRPHDFITGAELSFMACVATAAAAWLSERGKRSLSANV